MKTYVNPLPIPSIPRGTDEGQMETDDINPQYRSISDPSVRYFDGKWYMYPSYGMAFVSEDFAGWKHVRTEPYNMKYSPDVIPFGDKYLMTGHSQGLYIGDSPLGPFEFLGDFIRSDGSEYRPTDPALFADDDGRIYLYFFDAHHWSDGRRGFCSGTSGVELDRENPRRFIGEPKVLMELDTSHEWERFGENRQDTLFGWIEGQWMIKYQGRYYLIYASAGTEYTSYCMAAYYSDKGPLEGFVCQKNNPITEKKYGFVRGAGHGCVTPGPNDTLWAFYTISLCYSHVFERRVGMDLLAVNDDGELYAPHGVTEVPMYAPGEADTPEINNSPGWLPLNMRQRGHFHISSQTDGHEGFYAMDDSMLTFWQAAEDDKEPWMIIDLMAPYRIHASRIMWKDTGLDYDRGIVPGPYKYVIEGLADGEWTIICDCSENTEDYNIDYRTFEPKVCSSIRLRITGSPAGITPAVICFTVFGNAEE